MKKKILISFALTVLLIFIAISSFAMNTMVDSARNMVGGTENMLENAGNNISNGVKNGLNTVTHSTENVVTDVKDGMQNVGNSMAGVMNGGDNSYTAQKTASDEITVAGMTTNTWSWIIIGITAAAIGILIWSYLKQKNSNDLYIDSNDL